MSWLMVCPLLMVIPTWEKRSPVRTRRDIVDGIAAIDGGINQRTASSRFRYVIKNFCGARAEGRSADGGIGVGQAVAELIAKATISGCQLESLADQRRIGNAMRVKQCRDPRNMRAGHGSAGHPYIGILLGLLVIRRAENI